MYLSFETSSTFLTRTRVPSADLFGRQTFVKFDKYSWPWIAACFSHVSTLVAFSNNFIDKPFSRAAHRRGDRRNALRSCSRTSSTSLVTGINDLEATLLLTRPRSREWYMRRKGAFSGHKTGCDVLDSIIVRALWRMLVAVSVQGRENTPAPLR